MNDKTTGSGRGGDKVQALVSVREIDNFDSQTGRLSSRTRWCMACGSQITDYHGPFPCGECGAKLVFPNHLFPQAD